MSGRKEFTYKARQQAAARAVRQNAAARAHEAKRAAEVAATLRIFHNTLRKAQASGKRLKPTPELAKFVSPAELSDFQKAHNSLFATPVHSDRLQAEAAANNSAELLREMTKVLEPAKDRQILAKKYERLLTELDGVAENQRVKDRFDSLYNNASQNHRELMNRSFKQSIDEHQNALVKLETEYGLLRDVLYRYGVARQALSNLVIEGKLTKETATRLTEGLDYCAAKTPGQLKKHNENLLRELKESDASFQAEAEAKRQELAANRNQLEYRLIEHCTELQDQLDQTGGYQYAHRPADALKRNINLARNLLEAGELEQADQLLVTAQSDLKTLQNEVAAIKADEIRKAEEETENQSELTKEISTTLEQLKTATIDWPQNEGRVLRSSLIALHRKAISTVSHDLDSLRQNHDDLISQVEMIAAYENTVKRFLDNETAEKLDFYWPEKSKHILETRAESMQLQVNFRDVLVEIELVRDENGYRIVFPDEQSAEACEKFKIIAAHMINNLSIDDRAKVTISDERKVLDLTPYIQKDKQRDKTYQENKAQKERKKDANKQQRNEPGLREKQMPFE